jgi:hypothetical protein
VDQHASRKPGPPLVVEAQEELVMGANEDRAALIRYLENDGTFFERLWLPLIRWVHRRCT